jgi:glutamyl-tRNA reductase
VSGDVHALVAHARAVPAADRARFAASLRSGMSTGGVLLETCHRVELYSADRVRVPAAAQPAGVERLEGARTARHLVALAVGRESAVIAEDQVLHQLRSAVQEARMRGPLAPELDRLLDQALRAGRRARSWLPARRRSLADAALDRVMGRTDPPQAPVLVIGAGEMGRRVAEALVSRGARPVVASRTPERARLLASRVGADVAALDPGPEIVEGMAGAVVALAGPWSLGPATSRALATSAAWVVDVSSPPAVDEGLTQRLGPRLVSIDDLTADAGAELSNRLVERLDELIERSVREYEAWRAGATLRVAARALDEKASAVRSEELAALWQRMPALEPAQRAEVEQMARRLTERLLRDPVERLREDGDGRHARAARELFRL